MEHVHIENGRRSTSKGSTWRDPWREEKPRSTDEKMERRTVITGHWPKWREEDLGSRNIYLICWPLNKFYLSITVIVVHVYIFALASFLHLTHLWQVGMFVVAWLLSTEAWLCHSAAFLPTLFTNNRDDITDVESYSRGVWSESTVSQINHCAGRSLEWVCPYNFLEVWVSSNHSVAILNRLIQVVTLMNGSELAQICMLSVG